MGGIEQVLEDHGEVHGHFWPVEAGDELSAPGILRWTEADGAALDLIGPMKGWGATGKQGTRAIHGMTLEGRCVTLPSLWGASRIAMGDEAMTFRSPMLVLEAHVTPDTLWTSQAITTAHLHEWMPETGFAPPDCEYDDNFRARRAAFSWEAPTVRTIRLSHGELTLAPWMQCDAGYGPDRAIRTSLTARFRPDEPMTLDALDRRFSYPLFAFTTFAADRADRVIREIVSHRNEKRRAVVLHTTQDVPVREWRPNPGRYLFQAHEIDDECRILARWFELFEQAGPAIGTFIDTIEEGTSYSRPRLIALVTAAEAYRRSLVRKKRVHLVDALFELRDHGGLDPALSGCSDDRLALIAAARNYYAQLGKTRIEYTPEEIDDAMVDNARCAAHLIQACLLRDLGVPADRAAELFTEHYKGWAVPTSPRPPKPSVSLDAG